MHGARLSFVLLLVTAFALVPVDSKADLIQPGDTVRIDFSAMGLTPGLPYSRLSTDLAFGLAGSTTSPREGNLLDQNEGFLLRAFDANGIQLNSWAFINPMEHTSDLGLAMFLDPQLNTDTGYVVLSEIVGSFDLIESLTSLLLYHATQTGPALPADWVRVPGTVTVTHTSVPEPNCLLLLGAGVSAIALAARRRRR